MLGRARHPPGTGALDRADRAAGWLLELAAGSLSTGLPRLAITASSPRSAASTSFDNWVLASSMSTCAGRLGEPPRMPHRRRLPAHLPSGRKRRPLRARRHALRLVRGMRLGQRAVAGLRLIGTPMLPPSPGWCRRASSSDFGRTARPVCKRSVQERRKAMACLTRISRAARQTNSSASLSSGAASSASLAPAPHPDPRPRDPSPRAPAAASARG